jgi:uncharacterized protein (TIRG00374 family)
LKEKIKQGLKIILFIVLSAALFYLAFRKVDISVVLAELKNARYAWLALSFTFSILALISRARRWIIIIKPLGYKPGLWNTYHALLTGYLVNFGLPRLGEFTRCVALGKKEKIPVDKLFGTVIAERAFDFISLLIILFLLLVLRNEIMVSFLRDYVFTPIRDKMVDIFGFSSLFLIILSFVLISFGYALYHFREKLQKARIINKASGFIKGIINGLKAFLTMENKIEFIFHTVFIWINYMLMTWVIVFMIPSTEHLSLSDGIFLLVIGSLAMAAPVQGGIGAFHWIVSRGLLVVYGIPLEDGLVYATLSHGSQMLLIAVLGTYSFYRIYRKVKKGSLQIQTPEPDGKI